MILYNSPLKTLNVFALHDASKKSLNRHGVKNTVLARPAETLALKKNDGELLFYFLFSDMETECYPCIPMHSASNQV